MSDHDVNEQMRIVTGLLSILGKIGTASKEATKNRPADERARQTAKKIKKGERR
jgi:hypothetical protein